MTFRFIQVMSANNEQTEEHIEKQDKVLNQLGNKRQMVLDFLSKGEKLMEDPNCPKFLEGHAKKLKEAWEETTEKANARKKALAGWFGVLRNPKNGSDDQTISADNLSSWETFETQRVECHRLLDVADKDFASIKKIFDLKAGPNDFRQVSKQAFAFMKVNLLLIHFSGVVRRRPWRTARRSSPSSRPSATPTTASSRCCPTTRRRT